jgi:hypothetical protein
MSIGMRRKTPTSAMIFAGAFAASAPADDLPVTVSLSSNASRPRSVALQWSAAPTATDLLPGQSGVFQRPGPAFFGTPDEMVEYQPDQPRWTNAAVCSASDGAYVADVAPGGSAISPQCVHGGYLIGRGNDMRLYRSADGVNWERVSNQPLSFVFSLSSGTLLGTLQTPDNYEQFWRSTDDGATWASAAWSGDGAACIWPNQNAYLGPWGFHQAANGTIIAVEYEIPDGGRFIYRSADDGKTWTIVHDEYQTTQISHYHTVTKHEGLDRWIAATGDGHDLHHIVASDDDGLTWYNYTAPHEVFAQPMALLDYGDPERLLFGSDLHWQVGELNVSDGPDRARMRSVLTNWNAEPGRGFCFNLFEHDGVYYACQFDNVPGNPHPVISVSRDRRHWAVYHRFTEGELGVFRYCGFIDGKLHLAIEQTGWLRHFAIQPADIAVRPALVVSPANTNLLDTPPACSGEATDGWLNFSDELVPGTGDRGLLESSTAASHHGDASLHYTRDDGGTMWLWSPSVVAPPDSVVRARLWIRGDCESCWLRFRWNYSDVGSAVHFSPNPFAWQEVVSGPIRASSPTYDLHSSLTCTSRNHSVLDVYVDSIQIEAGPSSPWQLGGVPRPAESWSGLLPAGSWTHIFTIQPEALSEYLFDDERLDICSYVTAAGDRATLSFDPLDRRFKLRAVSAVRAEPILETKPQRFQRQAQIRFAVRNTQRGLTFSVANGQPLERAGPSPTIPFSTAESTWRPADAFLMPATWLDSIVIATELSDANLALATSPPVLPSDWQPSAVRIERRPPGGTWQTLVELPATPAQFTDHAGLPGETWEYRAIAAKQEWWSAPSPTIAATFALRGDVNGDGFVDLSDLTDFLSTFGRTSVDPNFQIDADFNADNSVDLTDLTLLLTAFGS